MDELTRLEQQLAERLKEAGPGDHVSSDALLDIAQPGRRAPDYAARMLHIARCEVCWETLKTLQVAPSRPSRMASFVAFLNVPNFWKLAAPVVGVIVVVFVFFSQPRTLVAAPLQLILATWEDAKLMQNEGKGFYGWHQAVPPTLKLDEFQWLSKIGSVKSEQERKALLMEHPERHTAEYVRIGYYALQPGVAWQAEVWLPARVGLVSVADASGDLWAKAWSRLGCAELALTADLIPEASDWIQKAEPFAKQYYLGSKHQWWKTRVLGLCYLTRRQISLNLEDFATAEQAFQNAVPIYEEGNHKYRLANALYGLAEVALKREDFDRAIALFRRAADLSENAAEVFRMIDAEIGVGGVFEAEGMHQTSGVNNGQGSYAFDKLTDTEWISRNRGYTTGVAWSYYLRARILDRWNRFNEPRGYLAEKKLDYRKFKDVARDLCAKALPLADDPRLCSKVLALQKELSSANSESDALMKGAARDDSAARRNVVGDPLELPDNLGSTVASLRVRYDGPDAVLLLMRSASGRPRVFSVRAYSQAARIKTLLESYKTAAQAGGLSGSKAGSTKTQEQLNAVLSRTLGDQLNGVQKLLLSPSRSGLGD